MRTLLPILALFLGGIMNITPAQAASRDHILQGRAGADWQPRLLLREQSPAGGDRSRPVLYIHGSTFPSALSIMFKLEGRSWADDLNAAGYDVFGLDFAGYGGSERYPGMDSASPEGTPRGRAAEASEQIARAVRFIMRKTGASRVRLPPGAAAWQPPSRPFWTVRDAAARIARLADGKPEGTALAAFLPAIPAGGANRPLRCRVAVSATFAAALELTRGAALTLDQDLSCELVRVRRRERDLRDADDAAPAET